MESAKKISEGGYKAGPRKLYGKGVYSSPSLVMVGELYAATFQHEGNTYKVALQNRVNPDIAGERLKIVPGAVTVGGVAYDYWVSQKHDASKGVCRCKTVRHRSTQTVTCSSRPAQCRH